MSDRSGNRVDRRTFLVGLAGAVSVQAQTADKVGQQDPRFIAIRVDSKVSTIRLFHRDESGELLGRFENLERFVARNGLRVTCAMNAGMYHADYSPVGLLIVDGQAQSPVNRDDGDGNFFLKPNGVFLIDDKGPAILETEEYVAANRAPRIATQSGPLLVRRGVLHPAIRQESISRKIRNAVGVAGSDVWFVISEAPVNFHEMAVYLRDRLGCQDGLYLDGVVSSLSVPGEHNVESGVALGPMLAVVEQVETARKPD